MFNFRTIKEGVDALKKYYFLESDVTEGEMCDNLIKELNDHFEPDVPTELIMGAIQAFRQWAHDRDELESEAYTEIECEYDGSIGDEQFQNYVFFDGSAVPYGTRIGIEILDKTTGEIKLELDSGICYP